jgi:hypothetical protein
MITTFGLSRQRPGSDIEVNNNVHSRALGGFIVIASFKELGSLRSR